MGTGRKVVVMARTWEDVKAERAVRGLSDPDRAAQARRILDDYVQSYRLAQIRKQRGKTQEMLAKTMGVGQGRVSQIENGDLAHTELVTLQSYVEALGGHVRIVADFGDDQILIA